MIAPSDDQGALAGAVFQIIMLRKNLREVLLHTHVRRGWEDDVFPSALCKGMFVLYGKQRPLRAHSRRDRDVKYGYSRVRFYGRPCFFLPVCSRKWYIDTLGKLERIPRELNRTASSLRSQQLTTKNRNTLAHGENKL